MRRHRERGALRHHLRPRMSLRVTEDAVEKPLAKVGLVGTVTRLRGFRQDVIDERAGVAGADVVVEESGAPCCWWCG